MRIIMCGGGTVGHITPAIAVAEELLDKEPSSKILFIGRKGGNENAEITKAGIHLETIEIQGMLRSLKLENLKRLKAALKARRDAKRIIRSFKPDLVFGTGGYVCWPVISAAKSMNIPTAIHESNISPGLTTKMLSGCCNKIFLNSKESLKYFHQKNNIQVVGNPLKKDFINLTRNKAREMLGLKPETLLILSFGGSGGAEKINEEMIEMIKNYSSKQNDIKHIHATGEAYFKKMPSKDRLIQQGKCEIVSYIHNMPLMMKAADIVISRSGAMTVSELCEAGVCSILIPSPNVTDNHQYRNAKAISDKGGAVLIEEEKLNQKVLIDVVKSLKTDKNRRKKQAKAIKELSTPNAAKVIVSELKTLINNRNR